MCEDRLTCRAKDKRSSAAGCGSGALTSKENTGYGQHTQVKNTIIALVCMHALLKLQVCFFYLIERQVLLSVWSAEVFTCAVAGPQVVEDRLRSGLCAS